MGFFTEHPLGSGLLIGMALAFALVCAVGLLGIAHALSGRRRASGIVRGSLLVGKQARVLCSVPFGGSGSARVCTSAGHGRVMPARGLDGVALASESEAVVVAVENGSVVLAPIWPELDLTKS